MRIAARRQHAHPVETHGSALAYGVHAAEETREHGAGPRLGTGFDRVEAMHDTHVLPRSGYGNFDIGDAGVRENGGRHFPVRDRQGVPGHRGGVAEPYVFYVSRTSSM